MTAAIICVLCDTFVSQRVLGMTAKVHGVQQLLSLLLHVVPGSSNARKRQGGGTGRGGGMMLMLGPGKRLLLLRYC